MEFGQAREEMLRFHRFRGFIYILPILGRQGNFWSRAIAFEFSRFRFRSLPRRSPGVASPN